MLLDRDGEKSRTALSVSKLKTIPVIGLSSCIFDAVANLLQGDLNVFETAIF